MNPLLIAAILVALVALATVLGLVWRSAQGRVTRADGRVVVRPADLPGAVRFADGATLVQFSTEVCAPCVATRRVLSGVASERDDVSHIDVDLTNAPELASRFHVLQTPTTLVLDRAGVVRARIGGAVRLADVNAELDRILLPA